MIETFQMMLHDVTRVIVLWTLASVLAGIVVGLILWRRSV